MRTCSSKHVVPVALPVIIFYAGAFSRISIAIFISFLARALSSIRSELFCYTAISSAGIVCILPGYLIRKFESSFLLPLV